MIEAPLIKSYLQLSQFAYLSATYRNCAILLIGRESVLEVFSKGASTYYVTLTGIKDLYICDIFVKNLGLGLGERRKGLGGRWQSWVGSLSDLTKPKNVT